MQTAKPAPRRKKATSIDGPTPAMRQYADQKRQVGDALLLFRMGDFYETFYDDAVTASRVLGIALTSRNKDSDNPIPLAGIPYHALEGYLRKLVDAGVKVAIAEQVEDPKTAKGVVKREVVRIVTAGTLTDEALLDDKSENILAAICVDGSSVGLATIELAGGAFTVFETLGADAIDELVRLAPAEILFAEIADAATTGLIDRIKAALSASIARRPVHEFDAHNAQRALFDHFRVTTLEGFGFGHMTLSLRAAGAALGYLTETQKSSLDHISVLTRRQKSRYVSIDQNSWRSLEIERTLRGGLREGSLLDAIDRTVHSIGSRRLRQWICHPLIDVDAIVARQDAIACFVEQESARRDARSHLRQMADIERITARVALLRASPRDLSSLAGALARLPELRGLIEPLHAPLLADAHTALCGLDDLADLLNRAINPDAPPTLTDGGVIADGFDAELDRLRAIRTTGQSFLARYQKELIDQSGISALKVGYNKVFGYYIEVPNSQRDRVPPDFVRKQTIKNAERYITDRLKKYEDEVLTAAEKCVALEVRLFDELRKQTAARLEPLKRAADAVGLIDCTAALAELAVENRYVRPQIVTERLLHIVEGRHPVLDQTIAAELVPNDTQLAADRDRVLIITGPNMAGKSTYVRQVALLTLLAQTGAYVPAAQMTLSPVDKVFARVGASDEIARGHSTFMVEMTEAAAILNTATDRSLVILDEIGRGTSTFDGLALAWAITEHIANHTHSLTLVATHYHEMTELADLLEGVRNFSVAVREYDDPENRDRHIVFLHKIVEGRTDKSYGIHVARMAGVPRPVIQRSMDLLEKLDGEFAKQSHTSRLAEKRTRDDTQLELFADPAQEIIKALTQLDPDHMTPIEALQAIVELKKQLD